MHYKSLPALFLALLLAGCGAGGAARVDWALPLLDKSWPPPPGTARIRLLRTVAPEDFVEEKKGLGKLLGMMTGETPRILPMVSPYGVAADGAGRIWVADSKMGVVHGFDLARGKVEYLTHAGSEQLQSPLGVAYDGGVGRLYVSDARLGQVFVFDQRGRLVGTRNPPEGYGRPAGMATDRDGNLYVVDVLKRRVDVFAREGEYRSGIVSTRPPENGFLFPSNVCVDSGGRIYVADTMNFRIEVFGQGGISLGTIGELGDVPGTFARPRGVAVDSDDHVYVTDAVFDNIQIFNSAGKLLFFFGENGKEPGDFSLPAGLFFDGEDRLYAVDAYNQRVQLFQYLPETGSAGR